MAKKSVPEPELESPIPFHTGSNGEFEPRPKTDQDRLAERTFKELVIEKARKLGMPRRTFVNSVLGSTTALYVANMVYGCGSDGEGNAGGTGGGGGFGVGGSMTMDPCEASSLLEGDEFIFDVQTHHVNPDGAWRQTNPGLEGLLNFFPQAGCGEMDSMDCYDAEHYIREMFVNSDTSVAVLSALPGPLDGTGLEVDEMAASMEIINVMANSQRMVIHAIVHPERGAIELDRMQDVAETFQIGAWKCYPPVGGWRLDDPLVGIPFIEKARELGIKRICIHKGFPLPGFDPIFAAPDDVGVVAAAYPDVTFIVYHSAFDSAVTEGAYDPMGAGVDRLIKAVQDNGIAKNTGNVYAELGSTWLSVMMDPVQSAHVVGKLIANLGEDRVVWGTDSIWYGSPQFQITAFRAFEIDQMAQDNFGYPALTPAIKAKIFGLNSAAIYGIDPEATLCAISEDQISRQQQANLEDPSLKMPSFHRVGPQTRREWFDFLSFHDGRPT